MCCGEYLCITQCMQERIALVFAILCWCFTVAYCDRRIVNGSVSLGEPKYLAYFVQSPKSEKKYTGWVCGGTIVHPLYILTSAACLEDLRYVYAIAGYNRYVRSEDIEKDACTRRTKKRVISRAYQKSVIERQDRNQWNARDISLAKVDSAYDFRDTIYVTHCSYTPGMILVNYKTDFENPGTQALTFGWGHKQFFRQEGDMADHNEEYVNYASTVVIDKQSCKQLLAGNDEIAKRVDSYLLCTSGPGDLDEKGKMNVTNSFNISLICLRRSNMNNKTGNQHFEFYMTDSNSKLVTGDNRRHGPCQNDHGGPLVTWVGGRQYVIGVACGFQVNSQMECVGPYLYTSTYSNGEFIYCILRYSRRTKLCSQKQAEQRGYRIVEEEINWD